MWPFYTSLADELGVDLFKHRWDEPNIYHSLTAYATGYDWLALSYHSHGIAMNWAMQNPDAPTFDVVVAMDGAPFADPGAWVHSDAAPWGKPEKARVFLGFWQRMHWTLDFATWPRGVRWGGAGVSAYSVGNPDNPNETGTPWQLHHCEIPTDCRVQNLIASAYRQSITISSSAQPVPVTSPARAQTT
jgi:hypothetical protein